MDILNSSKSWKWQVLYFLFLGSWGWVSGQLRYAIVEESEPGTFVGNVAQDLGLKITEISKRRLRMGSEESRKYFSVNWENGVLTINEKIDRESLCGSSASCLLPVEVVIENPLQLHHLVIEILDINDNPPIFSTSVRTIRITELIANPGARFPLESAHDLDVGVNGIKQYSLDPNPYFSLSVKKRKDGILIPELLLEKTLDREEINEHHLILTAVDGGDPPRSGTSQIHIIVLDLNDNAPTFDKSSFKIHVKENIPLNTVLLKLNATDQDEGANGEIEYLFNEHTPDSIQRLFALNKKTGVISTNGPIDYEETSSFEISVIARDKGVPEMEGSCTIQVEVEDDNDNSPEILITSLVKAIPEDTAVGTVIGLFSVNDRDSGKNGDVRLDLPSNLPFKFTSLDSRHYSLITDSVLDREKISQYVIELIASDMGSPPLRTQQTIILNVSDVNDNCPTFEHATFTASVKENNQPGQLLIEVSAFDPDEGENSDLIYSILESQVESSSISSFVYINSKDGNIYAQRSFDFEHVQVLQIPVRVEDSGFPKKFSNTTVFIFILDTNDNSPTIFHPEHSKDLIAHQKISKSASGGYLVTKVTAVDSDSGYNSWLSYNIEEATDSSLFRVSAHTGEIRTTRALQESDNSEQHLVISVSDHGDPPLSATVTIIVTMKDGVIQDNIKSSDFFQSSTNNSDITMYLIISLVAISAVSCITFVILLTKCLKKDLGHSVCCCKSEYESKYCTEQCQPTLHLNTDGTLKYMEVRMAPTEPQGQCYKSCFSTMSDKNDFTFMRPLNFPQLKNMVSETEVLFPSLSDPSQQAQPNTEWRFSQAQRPGPSGAQPAEEAGVWPNNQFETERLQAMILASANEAAEGTSGLGGGTGTMGLSARYGPQFTLQHVPDYRQNVYIPGSTLTPTNGGGKRDGKGASGGGNKKKSGKKEKK